MNRTSLLNTLRRTAAFTLAVVLSIPTVFANAGEPRLRTSTGLTDGLTFHNAITENYKKRVESFSLELAPSSPVKPIFVQGSGSVYGGANINKAVSRAQAQGYHVLGAVNTDFFSTSTGVPIGLSIEDGVYKSSNPGHDAVAKVEDAVVVGRDGSISLVSEPQVKLTLTNSRSGRAVSPHHLNKARSGSGGIYLLNRDFSSTTRTSSMGWNVVLRLVDNADPALRVNGSLTLEVTQAVHTDQALSIGANEYVLTSDDRSGYGEVMQSFQPGDRITLTSSCSDPALADARWATGVGDVMIRDGKLTDSSQWTYIQSGRAPRTALGMKADGTLLVYAVDGRQPDYSNGLGQLDLAQELLEQNCVWAVNLDGGGSTAMSVWLPGQTGPQLLSRPSDGGLRSCATYLLLVSPSSGSGSPHRLALKQSDLVVLAGSSVTLPGVAVLDDGLNVLDRDPGSVKISSKTGLGSVSGNVFTAGSRPGVETLTLTSSALGVSGEAHIYVVDHLTDLKVSSHEKSLSGRTGDRLQLSVTGSYWDRPALHSPGSVVWTVTGGAGSVDKNGLLTVNHGGSGSVTASAGGRSVSLPFSFLNTHLDVPEGHWAYGAVEYCYQNGIASGLTPTRFGAELPIIRGDFVVMIHSALGKPEPPRQAEFQDVSDSDYYHTAISWAQANGVISGTGGGCFSPQALITREQAFAILYKTLPILGKPIPKADLSVLDRFPDRDQISPWAREATASMVSQGLIAGDPRGILPLDDLRRDGMAALMRTMMTFGSPVEPQPPEPSQPTGTVIDADDGLRIRSGPGTQYEILGHLYTGAQVEILEDLHGWYRIRYQKSSSQIIEGYVSSDYVRVNP